MSHALTFRNDFLREHSPVLAVSVLLHLALLVLLTLNLNLLPRRPAQPVRLAIQATVVNAQALRQRAAEQERIQQQVADLRRQREAEREQRAEDQRQEVQRQQEQRRLADQQRQEQIEAQRREQSKRQQEAEKTRVAKVEQQKKAADEQAKAASEAKRKADAERKQAQTKADLARQMAEEEELAAAADSGLLDQYAEIIAQKVERNWIRPASARAGISCVVLVKQIPGGDIVDVRVSECNGDEAVVRSIEAAVLRSSPLPPPPNAALFDRSLRFNFKPRD